MSSILILYDWDQRLLIGRYINNIVKLRTSLWSSDKDNGLCVRGHRFEIRKKQSFVDTK